MSFRTDIFLHPFNPVDRQIKLVITGIFDEQEIALSLTGLQMLQPTITTDAMISMDNKIILFEFGQRGEKSPLFLPPGTPPSSGTENILLGKNGDPLIRQAESGRKLTNRNRHFTTCQIRQCRIRIKRS